MEGVQTEEYFILDSIPALKVETRDFVLEALPLRLSEMGIK